MASAKMEALFNATRDGSVTPLQYGEQADIAQINRNLGSSEYQNNLVGIPGWIRKMMGYDVEAERSAAITAKNQEYERASIDSARAWSEYMDNTQTQRRVKDIESAGLNPWLAVQNGISGSGAPSVDTGGTAQQGQSQSGQSSGILRGLLLLIAGIAAKNPKVAASGAVAITNKSWYK